jgi:mercuric ion transport protein
MRRRVLLRTGLIGSAVTAVCCFTPILVVLLAGLGLSAALGWLDWILLPVLAFFLAMTAYGLWLGWRRS